MATQLVPAPETAVEHVPHLEDMATRIKPRTASNILLWGVVGFFVAGFAWAALTQLDRSIHAPGRIVPGSRLQVISHLEGGIVSRILIKAGDLVKKGQPLLVLDRTASGAELGAGESQAASLSAKIARLEAEVQGREPSYPSAAGNPALAEQIAIERALHASRVGNLASASSAAAARVSGAQRAVTEAQASYQSRISARKAYEQQLALVRPLVDRGIEPRMTQVQLESNLSIAQSDAAAAAAAVARAQSQVAESVATLSQLRQDWRTQAANELATSQAEFAARRSAMPALEDKVARAVITAPMDGRINRVTVSTVGAAIGAGQPLVELVPSEDTLMIEGLVSPKDIGFVRIGQKARINVSAYEAAIYGSMDGEVVTISPDATVDERTGESHYTVKVRTNSNALKDARGDRLPLGPGMTADVNLLGDKRSVLSYLFTPITRLSEQAMRE